MQILWSASVHRDTNQRAAQRRILLQLRALAKMDSEEGSSKKSGSLIVRVGDMNRGFLVPESDKPNDVTPSPKWLECSKRFSEARETDSKNKNLDVFDSVITGIFFECVTLVKEKYSAKLPSLRAQFLSQRQFDELCHSLGIVSRSSYAFIEHVRGILAVNVSVLLGMNDFDSFLVNLVLCISEELLHAGFPLLSEVEIKKLTFEATESYLGVEIPEDYKRDSYERAADPSYGK